MQENVYQVQHIAGANGLSVCVSDLRSLLRLLGEMPTSSAGPREFRQHFLDGLTRILRADTWTWTWSPDEFGNIGGLQYGHLTTEESALLPRVLEAKGSSTPLALGIMDLVRLGRATTVTLRALLPSCRQSATSNRVADIPVLPAFGGSGDVLISWLPGSSGGYSCLWFCRRESGSPFTAREHQLVHLVFNEVAWLRGESSRSASAGPSREALPPRTSMVLTLLLDGKVAKEIAQVLGISTRTVREHIERIYRHFGVDGRPGLHRHFSSGAPSTEVETYSSTRSAPVNPHGAAYQVCVTRTTPAARLNSVEGGRTSPRFVAK